MPAPAMLPGLEEEIEMSQRNRIVLAALALVAATALVSPAPTRAAGFPTARFSAADAFERAWTWIAHLVTGILLCLTIIGIPLGLANFKIIPVSFLPLGVRIVDSDALVPTYG